MIDLQKVRDQIQAYKTMCAQRNMEVDIDRVISLDDQRKALQGQIDQLKYQQKQHANEQQYDQAKALKEEIKVLEEQFTAVKQELEILHYTLPNFIHPEVTIGKNEDENVILKEVGTPRTFDFEIKDHEELGIALGILDKEKAAQVAGARFVYLKGDIVLMQNAIAKLTFDTLTNEKILAKIIKEANLNVSERPFVPVIPPLMINFETAEKMGRLHPMDDRFIFPEDKYMMIGSAEHSLGPLHMDEIIPEESLPLRYVANTPAFRREAGTYGKDTRGILRVHQFDKIEMEIFSTPEQSEEEQKLIVAIQEYLLQQLELPYQVIGICTGDMGKPDYRQIDINTYMPGQGNYRETHTSDLMTDYQARRLNIRTQKPDGTKEFVHMNDATAFALGRILIAVMENYQNADGTITIPKVLQSYVGKERIG
ncbi:MAG: serine--tRNA ligase [bacterium]|nr:serine--tRNA ligase [bacterium]